MKPNIPFPKTRLEDYLEYRKEISSEVNLAGIRYELTRDKEDYDNLKNKIDKIYSRYVQLLHSEDTYFFNNIAELKSFLKNDVKLSDYKIRKIMKHEKEHINRIYELGYIIKGFGCVLLTHNNKMTYAVQTIIDTDKTIPYVDFISIVSAPKNPSITDKYHF